MLRVPKIVFGLSLALALGGTLLLLFRSGGSGDGASSDGNAAIGGPFRLIDQDGHVRSDRDFRGHWALVYFGYSYCPDVCPTTLQEIADAYRQLGSKAHRVVPLFITLDPERDHPATMKRYLAAFGPEFVGLTGTPQQIKAVAHAYHVYFAKRSAPGGGYSVDHASTIYLMAPDGKFAALLDGQEKPHALANEISSHL
jgi:cytochrome oxidase Cu insertion factor (SCO1/SenC/PrrC family)